MSLIIPANPTPTNVPRQLPTTDAQMRQWRMNSEDARVWVYDQTKVVKGVLKKRVEQTGPSIVSQAQLQDFMDVGWEVAVCRSFIVGGPSAAVYKVLWAPSWVDAETVDAVKAVARPKSKSRK
jgi:hypothetical protein